MYNLIGLFFSGFAEGLNMHTAHYLPLQTQTNIHPETQLSPIKLLYILHRFTLQSNTALLGNGLLSNGVAAL